MYRILLLSWICLVLQFPAHSQEKKPLDHNVYDIWNKVYQKQISPDGHWIFYRVGPENLDKELRLRGSDGAGFARFPRGKEAVFSADSRYLVFNIEAPKDSVTAAKKAGKKKDDLPKDSLAIARLGTTVLFKRAHVKSFQLPKEAGAWVAYLVDEKYPPDSSTQKEKKGVKKKEHRKQKPDGFPLVLREMNTGEEHRFEHVTEYSFSENGQWLAYCASSKDSSADGIFAVLTETGETIPLLTGPGVYKKPVFDKAGKQLAFLSNTATYMDSVSEFYLYYWEISAPRAALLAKSGTPGFAKDWVVSEHAKLYFSQNGKRLFFGSAPRPKLEPEEEELEDEKVVVDIWNWKDPYLQPMQKKQLEKEKKRSYLAMIDLKKKRLYRLGNTDLPVVTVGDNGNADAALGLSNLPYRQLISWDYPPYYDVYLLNLKKHTRQKIVEKLQYKARLSPLGNYLYWWDRAQQAWLVYSAKTRQTVNVSADIPTPLQNEDHDWPFMPDPYGAAGWTQDDRLLLIYDRHDIWAVDPAGKQASWCLTDSAGRKANLRLRYIHLDPEHPGIPDNRPLLLSAFHYQNKQAGFYRDVLDPEGRAEQLLINAYRYSKPQKARLANRLLFSRESFQEFPDLWTSSLRVLDMKKLTDINPQQKDYLWGSAELLEFTSLDGQPLQGILYKPENFDPSQKYPLMVYFYERNSDHLYRHWAPAPHRSIINFTFYVSRGYLVFVPDIPYKIGYPGQSAFNAVMPGVTHLLDQGFVDRERIGVQGHSWGGYQIAYLVTRTNLFRAAEAGAPVSNMFSAYGGIRWRSGRSRMFQYERTQSRIGGSIWEYPLRYIENSPIFWVDKIETPLLILHNDHDGAVPWYQGIELFTALRRLGKPAWLINYNDEPHWPVKYLNKKDWAMRLQTYFDHFLKDAPAPAWMEEGVPAIKKGKTLGLEPAGKLTD